MCKVNLVGENISYEKADIDRDTIYTTYNTPY